MELMQATISRRELEESSHRIETLPLGPLDVLHIFLRLETGRGTEADKAYRYNSRMSIVDFVDLNSIEVLPVEGL
jgi:hypothetical protein